MTTSEDSTSKSTGTEANVSADVFISFAWGDESEAGQMRQKAVDSLEKCLRNWGYNPLVDRNQLRNGDQISDFMKRIGRGGHVVVILSAKYLRSPYCMTELHYIYQGCGGEKNEFVQRIIPVVLPDAKIDDWRSRAEHSQYWKNEYEAMELRLKHFGAEDQRAYQLAKQWHATISDMLAFISDKLSPRTWELIEKDNFQGIRDMLPQVSLKSNTKRAPTRSNIVLAVTLSCPFIVLLVILKNSSVVERQFYQEITLAEILNDFKTLQTVARSEDSDIQIDARKQNYVNREPFKLVGSIIAKAETREEGNFVLFLVPPDSAFLPTSSGVFKSGVLCATIAGSQLNPETSINSLNPDGAEFRIVELIVDVDFIDWSKSRISQNVISASGTRLQLVGTKTLD